MHPIWSKQCRLFSLLVFSATTKSNETRYLHVKHLHVMSCAWESMPDKLKTKISNCLLCSSEVSWKFSVTTSCLKVVSHAIRSWGLQLLVHAHWLAVRQAVTQAVGLTWLKQVSAKLAMHADARWNLLENDKKESNGLTCTPPRRIGYQTEWIYRTQHTDNEH